MNLRKKYQKVKVLAERGSTEGERESAKEAMKRMEEKHPELIQFRHDPETGRFRNQWGESFVKGYQGKVTLDEATNLDWSKFEGLFKRSGVWVGVDMGSPEFSSSTTIWTRNPDGTWKRWS